jgi:hypothetical protein
MEEVGQPGYCIVAGSDLPCDPPRCGCPALRPGETLTWQNSGISAFEQMAIRRVAVEYPFGAYAEFVRLLDRDSNVKGDS